MAATSRRTIWLTAWARAALLPASSRALGGRRAAGRAGAGGAGGGDGGGARRPGAAGRVADERVGRAREQAGGGNPVVLGLFAAVAAALLLALALNVLASPRRRRRLHRRPLPTWQAPCVAGTEPAAAPLRSADGSPARTCEAERNERDGAETAGSQEQGRMRTMGRTATTPVHRADTACNPATMAPTRAGRGRDGWRSPWAGPVPWAATA